MTTQIEVGFNAEVRQAIALFNEAKDLAKRAEALKSEAEAVLRTALAGNTVATVGGVKAFSLEHRQRTNINGKALAEQFPEAYAEVTTTTEYDFIKTG